MRFYLSIDRSTITTHKEFFSFLFGTESKIRQMELKKDLAFLFELNEHVYAYMYKTIRFKTMSLVSFFQMLTTNQDKFQRKMNESLAKSIKNIAYMKNVLNPGAHKVFCIFF